MRKFIAIALLATTTYAHASAITVGTLDGTNLRGFECGLYLVDKRHPNAGLVFFANASFEGFAQLKGEKVQFEHIQTENKRKREDNVTAGDTYKTTWEAPNYSLYLDMSVDTTCPGARTECPQVKEHGLLSVTNAMHERVALPVEGYEGCLMEQKPTP